MNFPRWSFFRQNEPLVLAFVSDYVVQCDDALLNQIEQASAHRGTGVVNTGNKEHLASVDLFRAAFDPESLGMFLEQRGP